MENKTTRQERPSKAAPRVSVESAAPAAKKAPTIKRNIPNDEQRPAVFVPLNNKGGIVMKLRNSNLSYFDKESGQVRQIRYAPLEPSVFVDEQSQNPVVEQVFMYDKMLVVPIEKPNLKKFLELHPDNQANGGSVFRMLDKEKPKVQELDNEFLVHDAISIIKSKTVSDLIPLAMSLKIDIDQDDLSVKRDLVRYARRNPEKFLDMTTNPLVEVRSSTSQAFDFNIVRNNGGAVVWYDTNKVIVTVPTGQDAQETLARYCMTDQGSSVLLEIDRQLAEIA